VAAGARSGLSPLAQRESGTWRLRRWPRGFQFTAGFSRWYTGGAHEFAVEIENLRDVIKAWT
jgi:hypothetical protein